MRQKATERLWGRVGAQTEIIMPRQPAPGVPLAKYRAIRAEVLLTCMDCNLTQVLDREAVIERLKLRGPGDERTGIRAVAGFVHRPCPRCGGARYETKPAFRDSRGQV